MTESSSTRGAIHSALTILNSTKLSPSVARSILPAFRNGVQDYKDFLSLFSVQLPQFPKPTKSDWDRADVLIEKHYERQVAIIPFGDERYPIYLGALADAPAVLFAKGDLSCFSRLPGVAVVGTRKASPAGATIAGRIARSLGERRWVIVSGLALGIDAAAHEGALLTESPTVAVLAHGLEKANPPSNADLGRRILDSGGLWVSEHPLGVHPKPQYFVERNRIQIGLSAGSIIVEGEERSGTITQAQFCVREKRPLFAVVPQSRDNPLHLIAAGPTMLVQRFGAYPVRSAEDYQMVEKLLHASRSRLLENGSTKIEAQNS